MPPERKVKMLARQSEAYFRKWLVLCGLVHPKVVCFFFHLFAFMNWWTANVGKKKISVERSMEGGLMWRKPSHSQQVFLLQSKKN